MRKYRGGEEPRVAAFATGCEAKIHDGVGSMPATPAAHSLSALVPLKPRSKDAKVCVEIGLEDHVH